MLSNVFSWSEVSTLFSFNTWTLLCALSVLPGKGGWLCARLNLACKYSHLSLLVVARAVLQERRPFHNDRNALLYVCIKSVRHLIRWPENKSQAGTERGETGLFAGEN